MGNYRKHAGKEKERDGRREGGKKLKTIERQIEVRACSIAKSCLTLCNPIDCNPPGSSVHGILQARILEWVATPSSRGSS